jgi:hypothetical protein
MEKKWAERRADQEFENRLRSIDLEEEEDVKPAAKVKPKK